MVIRKIFTALTMDLSTGIVTKGSSYFPDKDTLVSIENVIGTAKNDNITGSSSNNVINGGAGNDTINGGAGSDTADYANAYSSVKADLSKSVATGHGSDSFQDNACAPSTGIAAQGLSSWHFTPFWTR